MINGIKPIIKPKPVIKIKTEFDKPKTNGLSFDEAMDNLLVKIQEDYNNWGSRTGIDKKLDVIRIPHKDRLPEIVSDAGALY